MKALIYFVLLGLHNGEEGMRALNTDETPQKVGWYWIKDDANESHGGPFLSREAAERDLAAAEGVTVLGYKFRPMRQMDWDAFAGAEEDTVICTDADDMTLLWSPKTGTLSEINEEGNQRDWTFTRIS